MTELAFTYYGKIVNGQKIFDQSAIKLGEEWVRRNDGCEFVSTTKCTTVSEEKSLQISQYYIEHIVKPINLLLFEHDTGYLLLDNTHFYLMNQFGTGVFYSKLYPQTGITCPLVFERMTETQKINYITNVVMYYNKYFAIKFKPFR